MMSPIYHGFALTPFENGWRYRHMEHPEIAGSCQSLIGCVKEIDELCQPVTAAAADLVRARRGGVGAGLRHDLGDVVTERLATLTAVLTKLRFGMADALTRGQPVPDWELRMWVAEIDALKADETPEETLTRVSHTGVLDLIEREIERHV
jgi:hypothetical protein